MTGHVQRDPWEMKMNDLEERIRERAYQIWEKEGRVHGRDEQHWHTAKLELTSALATPSATVIGALEDADAAPAKKARRTAKPKAPPAVPPASPRRRRNQAPLQ